MKESGLKYFDFLVAGSGFGGSIMAMCLKQSGFSVSLIERDKHPRFSIGESSTPIADMILKDLSETYDLPVLRKLSRYGEWQKHYPEVVCGLKRGFSYYPQKKDVPFTSDRNHINELLVAASVDDINSDTNWLRSDVDALLVKEAMNIGVTFYDESEIETVLRDDENESWDIGFSRKCNSEQLSCGWLIDATGTPEFSRKFLGTSSSSEGFETNSAAVYSHFENAGKWLDYLQHHSFCTNDYPYNPDHSALHHLIDEGWIWMLRFNNNLLSAGIVADLNQAKINEPAEDAWTAIIKKYPSVERLFTGSVFATIPGKLIKTRRLQRKLNTSYGEGWVAMNHTTGFVDPLHSTGIAHTLTGVEKLASLFLSNNDNNFILIRLKNIRDQTEKELHIIDLLVSICYLSRKHFSLFTASVMLYFIASIQYEQRRLRGEIPDTFLCADDDDLYRIINQTHHEIKTLMNEGAGNGQIERQIGNIKQRIEPFNRAGLMDPAKRNMYRHTAVRL